MGAQVTCTVLDAVVDDGDCEAWLEFLIGRDVFGVAQAKISGRAVLSYEVISKRKTAWSVEGRRLGRGDGRSRIERQRVLADPRLGPHIEPPSSAPGAPLRAKKRQP